MRKIYVRDIYEGPEVNEEWYWLTRNHRFMRQRKERRQQILRKRYAMKVE